MQLDSHRRLSSFTADTAYPDLKGCSIEEVKVSTTVVGADIPASRSAMPCPRSRCAKPVTFTAEDGTKMQAWHSVRRDQVRSMRKMVKRIVFYMALMEAVRVGPVEMIMAGQHGYPAQGANDFGIAYYGGYILSYIYLCVFMVVWKPFFSWWVPSPEADSSTGKQIKNVNSIIQQINMVLLPLSISISVGEYLFWLVTTFIYVDARPVNGFEMPKNSQKNWLARIMLLVGIFVSTSLGYGVFEILGQSGLARVKCLEYMIIVVPIQINIGIMFGSLMQWRMEKREERKALVLKALEPGSNDEKEALLSA